MEISELVEGAKDVWESKTEERLYHWFASKEPYEIKNGLSDIYKEAEKMVLSNRHP